MIILIYIIMLVNGCQMLCVGTVMSSSQALSQLSITDSLKGRRIIILTFKFNIPYIFIERLLCSRH